MTNIRTGAAILVSVAGLSLIGGPLPSPALAHADSSPSWTPNQDSVFAKQNQDFFRLLTESDQDHPMVGAFHRCPRVLQLASARTPARRHTRRSRTCNTPAGRTPSMKRTTSRRQPKSFTALGTALPYRTPTG